MNENDWLSSDDPQRMVYFVHQQGSYTRKLRLFAVECGREVRPFLLDDRSRQAIDFADKHAERPFKGLRHRRQMEAAAHRAMAEAISHCRAAQNSDESTERKIAENAAYAAKMVLDTEAWVAAIQCGEFLAHIISGTAVVSCRSALSSTRAIAMETARKEQSRTTATLLRDIFGNPFRPVAFDPEWRTSTAVALARQMYEARDHSLMPILADALQDAGCDHADILDHCRGPGPHARGCWVVDLVLGKE